MRGIRGTGDYKQQIVAWHHCNGLQLTLAQYHEKLRDIGRSVEEILLEWAEEARVSWCSVREARPEVTVRRDVSSPLSWFRSKTVAVWGCGAIGCLSHKSG